MGFRERWDLEREREMILECGWSKHQNSSPPEEANVTRPFLNNMGHKYNKKRGKRKRK